VFIFFLIPQKLTSIKTQPFRLSYMTRYDPTFSLARHFQQILHISFVPVCVHRTILPQLYDTLI